VGLANRITVARGALAILLWAILHAIDLRHEPGDVLWWAAFAVFVVTAATDSLDGYVARKRGEVSVFGRIADPFVDKLLILGSMIFLLGLPGMAWIVPPWTVAVVLARELLVTTLRSAVEASGGNFQAGPWGKWKMVAQCIAIGAAILYGAGVQVMRVPLDELSLSGRDAVQPEWPLARAIAVGAAVLTVASGVEYTARALRMLRGASSRA
jgi:CDP-diacylglycerol---glycerol-3-phosphate 3-phosphatidyltransferase